MKSPLSKATEARINALVDESLIAAYWDAAKHYGTGDLVLVFDESRYEDPVLAYPRLKLLENPKAPAELKSRVTRPAVEAAKLLTDSETAFWLIAMFADGEAASLAVNAKVMAPGGHA